MKEIKCKYCDKMIGGYTDKHVSGLMKQHVMSKHPDKVVFE